MKVILTIQPLNSAEFCVPFSSIDSFAFDAIKWRCVFSKYAIQKFTKQQSMSIS